MNSRGSSKIAVFGAMTSIFVLATVLGQPQLHHTSISSDTAEQHSHEGSHNGKVEALSMDNAPSVAPAAAAAVAANGGKWDPIINFGLVPGSAVVLPNNKLLTFSAYSNTKFNQSTDLTKVSIYDLATGAITAPATVDTNHQMFCSGITLLNDGKVLISGGSSDEATTIYNPFTNTWSIGPSQVVARAYQGNTLLSDGKVFTVGGSWYDHAGGKIGEVWTPNTGNGTWRTLPNVFASNILTADPAGVYRADNHAWLFATSNGGVFHAGPSKQMNWITTAGNGTIKSAGLRSTSADAMNGNAVMYDVNKIVTMGGSTAYQDRAATKAAYKISIAGGPTQPVITTRVGDMNYARGYNNSVVLPNGEVMVSGGQPLPKPFTDTNAVKNPEIWNPATGQFSIMNPENEARTYHSVALLLPDGRVFSGGGGLCSACMTVNDHLTGQIFSPPYLVNENGTNKVRPVITAAPAAAAPGATITVTTNLATPTFALVRTSGVTHSVNNDQRRIAVPAPTLVGTNQYRFVIPADRGIALPGYYMLFAMNANGTPSVSKMIRIN